MEKNLKPIHWLLKHALTVGISVLIVTLGTIFVARSALWTTSIGEDIQVAGTISGDGSGLTNVTGLGTLESLTVSGDISAIDVTATDIIAAGVMSEGGTFLSEKYSTGGLAATGQTESYRPGDDGTYQKGAQFIDYYDGTFIDPRTGLMWPKDGEGPGYNSGNSLNWNMAIDWAEGLVFAGHDDWRLPNIHELKSFWEMTCSITQIQPSGFERWSSTSRGTDAAMTLGCSKGNVDSSFKSSTQLWVVAVRGE